MPHLIRRLCIGLAVAILAAMNLHGLSQSQHVFVHAGEGAAVALIESGDDHPADHVHLAPDEGPDTDNERDGEGSMPFGHHHHGGGDGQAAMPSLGRVLTNSTSTASILGRPGPNTARSSHTGDGPDHPPKRMRTVV